VTWGFEEGRVYNRRADIHARFGGQQQGGIITPAQHPLVIIITGRITLLAHPVGCDVAADSQRKHMLQAGRALIRTENAAH
jgi:hypothetical protein